MKLCEGTAAGSAAASGLLDERSVAVRSHVSSPSALRLSQPRSSSLRIRDRKRLPLVVLAFAHFCPVMAATVTDLRCEYLRNPQGIDATRPRLSWVIKSDVRGE